MSEVDLQPIVKELKAAYGANDVVVASSADREEYRRMILGAIKPELLKTTNKSEDFTGMVFLPAFNTADNKPHIIVHLVSADPSSYLGDLTHEFSNYEVYKRWGSSFKQFHQLLSRHLPLLFRQYKARVTEQETSQDQALLDAGVYPAQQIRESYRFYGFPLYDAVISVPPNYITIEKGFDKRLAAWKLHKMRTWSGYMQDNDISKFWIFDRFPYLAYSTFHPDEPEIEEELDTFLKQLLEKSNCTSSLTPIRRIRELFHSVKLPVEANNLYEVYTETEIIFYSHLSERTVEWAGKYWVMMRDSVAAIRKSVI